MRRFLFSVLMVGMIITGIAGFTSTAAAASTYTALTCPGYKNGNDRVLGKVKIDIANIAELTSPDTVSVVLPSGVNFKNYVLGASASGSVNVTAPILNSSGDNNPLYATGTFTTTMTSSNSFDIVVYPSHFASGDGYGTSGRLLVDFCCLDLVNQSGEIVATFLAPSGSGFSTGTAVIGFESHPGTCTLVSSIKTVSPGEAKPVDTIIIGELCGGSLQINNSDPTTYKTVKLTLPEGVTWNEATTSAGGWAATGTDDFVIGNFNGRDAYITVNHETTTTTGRIGISPVLNIDDDFTGEMTLTVSGDNPGVTPATVIIAVVAGVKISADNDTFETSKNPDGITTATVKPGVSGLKYLTATAYLMPGAHDGDETMVFSHFRSGIQQDVTVLQEDFRSQGTGQAGFNVQPGDIIEVYLVDDLTADLDKNPVMIQN